MNDLFEVKLWKVRLTLGFVPSETLLGLLLFSKNPSGICIFGISIFSFVVALWIV